MAKKFHVTPEGITSHSGHCGKCYSQGKQMGYFESKAEALAAEKIIKLNLEFTAELNELKKVQNSNKPEYQHIAPFLFDNDNNYSNGSARDFGYAMVSHLAQHGMSPLKQSAIMNFRLTNSAYIERIITVLRKPVIDEGLPQFVGQWGVSLREEDQIKKGYSNRKSDPKEHFILNFGTVESTVESLTRLKDLCYKTIVANHFYTNHELADGVTHEEEFTTLAQSMVDAMWSMFIAVESETGNVGSVELWEKGCGYFAGSQADVITVDVDYNGSSFRAESFCDFIRNNAYYSSYQPDAEIRVTDTNTHTGASWSLYRKDGLWSIVKISSNGTMLDSLTATPEDAYAHVYWHVMNEVNVDNSQIAFQKAQYAQELVEVVEAELERNKEVIFYEIECERLSDIARKNGYDVSILYSLEGHDLDNLYAVNAKVNSPWKDKIFKSKK